MSSCPPGLAFRHTEAMGYAARLAPWAADAGVELGRTQLGRRRVWDQVDLLVGNPVPVMSFTFGMAEGTMSSARGRRQPGVGDHQRPRGDRVGAGLGVDGVVAARMRPVATAVVRSTTARTPPPAALLAAVRARTELPVLAAGGVMTGPGGRALLEGGASAVAFGAAFLAPWAVLSPPCTLRPDPSRVGTTVTRASSGAAPAPCGPWTDRIGARLRYFMCAPITAPACAREGDREADLVLAGRGMPGCGRAAADLFRTAHGGRVLTRMRMSGGVGGVLRRD